MSIIRDDELDVFNTDNVWQRVIVDFTPELVKHLCIKLIPKWNHLSIDDIKVSRFSTGTLNYVFKISTRIPNEFDTVVFRVFDYSLDIMINRDRESEAFFVAGELGVGPKQFHKFENFSNRGGRIEEYVPGSNLVYKQYTDMNVACLTAKEIGRFHSLMTPKFQHWPKEPMLISSMNNWMDSCAKFPGYETFYDESELRANAQEYLSLLRGKAATGRFAYKIMMCHNDIHLFNLLYNDKENKMTLLDLEFAGLNYLGYDLCNYMCEACIDYLGADVIPFLAVHSQMVFPEDVELQMVKIYLDHMGVTYDDAFISKFREDIKFIEIGWWLARVPFNVLQALHNKSDVRVQCLKIYSKLCYDTYKLRKEKAIKEGYWGIN